MGSLHALTDIVSSALEADEKEFGILTMLRNEAGRLQSDLEAAGRELRTAKSMSKKVSMRTVTDQERAEGRAAQAKAVAYLNRVHLMSKKLKKMDDRVIVDALASAHSGYKPSQVAAGVAARIATTVSSVHPRNKAVAAFLERLTSAIQSNSTRGDVLRALFDSVNRERDPVLMKELHDLTIKYAVRPEDIGVVFGGGGAASRMKDSLSSVITMVRSGPRHISSTIASISAWGRDRGGGDTGKKEKGGMAPQPIAGAMLFSNFLKIMSLQMNNA